MCKEFNETMKALGGLDFKKYALPAVLYITIIYHEKWSKIGYAKKKSCKFVKNKLFSIRIIHAHLIYIWNKCAKNSNETMKALGGLDFIKYCILAMVEKCLS